ncbi:MAG: hypothetical protein WBK28_03215 [Minisyncoccia bacterium]
MTDVQFDDEQNQVSTIAIVKTAPTGLLAWLIKSGIAKNAKIAEQILLYIALASIAVGIVAPFMLQSEIHTISPTERARLELILPNPPRP